MTDTTEALRVAARSIALACINGWGNLCNEAADTIDTLRDENKRLEADVKEMRKALFDATAHLIWAASAYEAYAKRSGEIEPKAVTDPFFETRHMDFHRAAGRARAYLKKTRWKHD